MFAWLSRILGGGGANLADEVARLREELAVVKAAGVAPASSGPWGMRSGPNLALARTQEQHYRGWPFAAVRAIATRCAGQPVKVGRLTGGRRAAGAKDDGPEWCKAAGRDVKGLEAHPLLEALADPNEVMVQWQLLYFTVAGLELTGRAYWWLDQGKDGRETIWPLPASWVRPVDEGRFFARYEVRPRGSLEAFTVPGEAMLRFHLPDPSNPLGALSPLQAVSRAVLADDYIQDAQQAAFRNGIRPGVAVSIGRNPSVNGQQGNRPLLTDHQRAQIIHAIKGAYRGVVNWDEPIILDGWIEDVRPVTNKPAEMGFLESGGAVKERITQAFGCNPIVLGQVENANRASAVVADENFSANTVNPLLSLMGQVMTGWFRSWYADPALVVWVEPARPRDEEAERARFNVAVKAGAVTLDEVRAFAGLAPLPKGGDQLVKPGAGGNGAKGSRARRKAFSGPGGLSCRCVGSHCTCSPGNGRLIVPGQGSNGHG